MPPLPETIIAVLLPFAGLFSTPVWRHAHVLIIGSILCQGRRTVAAALGVMGLAQEPRFERYHRVLSRAHWSGLQAAHILLGLVIQLLPAIGSRCWWWMTRWSGAGGNGFTRRGATGIRCGRRPPTWSSALA